jgi:hypothetical protein
LVKKIENAAVDTTLANETRRVATFYLLRFSSPPLLSVDEVLDALMDENPETRCAAAHCLGQMTLGDRPDAVPALMKGMQDDDATVRRSSITALHQLGTDLASGAIPALATALRDADIAVRREAIATLAWLTEEAWSIIPDLVAMMVAELDAGLREAAVRAMLVIDPDHVSIVDAVKKLDDPSRAGVLQILRAVGEDGRALRKELQAVWNQPVDRRPVQGRPQVDPHPDGPEEPDKFWWKGRKFDISPTPCRLLTALWRNENVKIEDILEHVWEQDDVSDNAIKSALNAMNAVLLDASVPFHYGRKGGFIVKK